METNTNTTVTPAQRIRANQKMRQLRAEHKYEDARVLEAAIYWESFPNSYSTEQLTLANALLRTEYGTGEWFSIGYDIYTIINNK